VEAEYRLLVLDGDGRPVELRPVRQPASLGKDGPGFKITIITLRTKAGVQILLEAELAK
jgi:hypothetical protein